ncbi:GNAT family N-acetyltransferase [Cohnella rhizosphaerae]|uniref:GNAT family N-acetyltransferase n=1 Tax=Cohnella rhizosphaerae TaxID=1457232 RepID=A0A9X4KT50_9BACL|nr:GNAT family N-acetyltransferase [Cohnella rhizosphaerae]MDG0810083.1 GNAT family N-acetyltransferase [Cohnella rhizosphaerae]
MRDDIRIVETKALNAWPALRQTAHDGWLLRQSKGYTKRSNSVQPLRTDTGADLRAMVGYCEETYRRAGLPTIFKITPLCEPCGLDGRLDEYGYAAVDRSQVLVRSLGETQSTLPLEGLSVYAGPTEAWMSAAAAFLPLNPEQRETASALLANSPLVSAFFLLRAGDVPAAIGIGVVDDGYLGLFDIATSLAYRNRGLGGRLVGQILRWGQSRGAHTSYLQVADGNLPAQRLYAKLGYEKLYDYWYRVRRP